ncbi:hypothetical protein SAMN04488502_1236 [Dendrosporobacter quercicolus]|uniref:Uncharacterized protein n=1 Tax=Dendrosporobacter quercicolus TaxID=146817 RepID=A0A1H0ATY2_9FIRM|nr:hypothetical protein SAMN04488502_1236 [Dendrosporobacter quercicolus]
MLEPLAVKEKIMELSAELNQADIDGAARERLMAELVDWCEAYFRLYNQLKAVPKLVV